MREITVRARLDPAAVVVAVAGEDSVSVDVVLLLLGLLVPTHQRTATAVGTEMGMEKQVTMMDGVHVLLLAEKRTESGGMANKADGGVRVLCERGTAVGEIAAVGRGLAGEWSD